MLGVNWSDAPGKRKESRGKRRVVTARLARSAFFRFVPAEKELLVMWVQRTRNLTDYLPSILGREAHEIRGLVASGGYQSYFPSRDIQRYDHGPAHRDI